MNLIKRLLRFDVYLRRDAPLVTEFCEDTDSLSKDVEILGNAWLDLAKQLEEEEEKIGETDRRGGEER